MPEESRTRRLAILIDADNTSPRIVAGLFEEVAKYGEASVRRIYGDFSGQRLKSLADILQKYAIDPYQQFAYTTGKNASDIALVTRCLRGFSKTGPSSPVEISSHSRMRQRRYSARL